jgi:serine/threonine protein kinase
LTDAELLAAKQARRHLDPLIGRNVGGWLVLGELGSGAFGTVFVAERQDGLRSALKVLARPADDPHENASALKKFQLETDALGALRHPGIVGLYNSGTFEDRPWLAMELVAGGLTLKKEIENRRLAGHGMPRTFSLAMLDQLLDALHTAHTSPQRIVHRDIKPENLMLTPVPGEAVPRLKVLDFGLAKFTESGTETSHALGTPAYMAPEQLWKRRIGPWTDLYAVGVISFELLTGRRPFLGTSEEVVQKKSSALYDVLTEAEGLPLSDAAARFFRKALAFEVDARYADAPTLGADLRALPELQSSLDYSGASLAGSTTTTGETARGEAVDLDTERQRLERLQQQMEAERRRLEEERRRLDSERSQMSAAVPPSFAPPTITPPGGGAGGSGGSSSKGGLFLGLAGGVLLVGIGLVFGRAWLTGARDEAEGADVVVAGADAGAEPATAADAVSAAAEEVATAAAATDDAVAVAADPDAAVAAADAAAATDDAVAAAPSDAASDPAAAAAAAADAAGAAVEAADAVAGPLGADTLTIQATAGSTAPVPAVVAPVAEPKPKPVDPKVLARRRAEEARRKAEAEAKAKEAAKQAAIADEFRRVQARRKAEQEAKKRAEAEKQKRILEEFKKTQKR